MVKHEPSDVFWVRDAKGHRYKVFQYTEYTCIHIQGQEYWTPGNVYYKTDGGDSVTDFGNGHFHIPALDVFAEWTREPLAEPVTPGLPRPFVRFKQMPPNG
jgi:hypothetical protein